MIGDWNLMPTLPAWGWAALAAIPLGIVLLYFLKLRREPVTVPSTFLWATTIEDLHVNSLFQRLRRSVLLLLQLLAVAMAVVALMRPGRRDEDFSTQRRIYLIDHSASMSATDGGEDGDTRLQVALRAAGESIDAMTDNEIGMVIAFSDRSETLQSFSGDRARLREAVGRIKPTMRGTEVRSALTAADGLANPRRTSQIGDTNDVQVAAAKAADLLIYSDGGFGSINDFSLGNLVPQYIPVGNSQTPNAAITAFSATRNLQRPGIVNVFATVAMPAAATASPAAMDSNAPAALTRTVTLRGDEQFLDASKVELTPGESSGLSFEIESEDSIRLTLSLDPGDALSTDDVAFTGIRPSSPASVLVVTNNNPALIKALQTPRIASISRMTILDPSQLSGDEYRRRAAAGTDDWIIYDRCAPERMPAASTLFLGHLPPNDGRRADAEQGSADVETTSNDNATENDATAGNSTAADAESSESDAAGAGWRYTGKAAAASIVDVNRGHPLMRYLEMYSLLIASARPIAGPPGTEVLVEADIGPIVSIAPRDGYQDCVVAFPLIEEIDGETVVNTNWYAERSWPVFLLNSLRSLAGANETTTAATYRPGTAVRVRVPAQVQTVEIRRWSADSKTPTVVETVRPGPGGLVETALTEACGNYEVVADDELLEMFSVNLFSESESSLDVAPELSIGFEAVEADLAATERRYEYWRWALLAMLGLVAGEWWLYSRRLA